MPGGNIRSTRIAVQACRSTRHSTVRNSIRPILQIPRISISIRERSPTPRTVSSDRPCASPSLRGFGGAYEDLGIIKDIRFGRYTAQVKFEVINVFNRHYFADPETNVGSPYFGQVTSLGGQTPRQGQLGVRFQW